MVNNNIGEIDFIQFNDNSAEYTPNEREIVWNFEEGTFDVGLPNGIIGQMFEELFFTVKASGAISDGDVVVFAGSVGNEILASSGLNSSSLDSHFIMGVATQNIADEAYGKVTAFGRVRGLNTIAFDDADDQSQALLYMSTTTPGKLTNIQPSAPNIKSAIATVKRWHQSVGDILVRPDFGSRLKDNHDVEITDPENGQVLTLEDDIWKNKNFEVAAENVTYEKNYSAQLANVQGALDQIFYMLQFVNIQLDAGHSNSIYQEQYNINGGTSSSIIGNNFDAGDSFVIKLNDVDGGGS